ncbi:uncharacterized protein LTHEOB_11111 [Lasiodiplodia theobromae]|uniref:uncharacterized protein n=1 Tax=Lasiodiplodia theobromae TaxID=45133 RepID=UPI0015C30D8B|nr:uncharacterized protein LTHEOB_11111 [Lasiodiplodia theobromae]KAF4537986.1 hypothetical protein LTHEOB_11111 [Lasiodiplodia theobromae]
MPASDPSKPPILPTFQPAAHPKRQNTTSSTTTRTTIGATPTPSRHNSSTTTPATRRPHPHHQRQTSSQSITRKPVPPPKRAPSTLARPSFKRAPTTQTQYVDLLVRLDEIPRWHNIVCAFCSWLLLAGYLVFPATFTKVQARVETEVDGRDDVVTVFVAGAVKNVGLLPGTTNSVAGLVSTLVNIYSAQDGKLSITAKVTKKHERQIEADEKRERQLNGEENVGAFEKLKRKAQEPAVMPGSVV